MLRCSDAQMLTLHAASLSDKTPLSSPLPSNLRHKLNISDNSRFHLFCWNYTHPLWALNLLDQVLFILAEHQVVLHLVAGRDVVQEVQLLQQVVRNVHVGDPFLTEVGQLFLRLLEELQVLEGVSWSKESSDDFVFRREGKPSLSSGRLTVATNHGL